MVWFGSIEHPSVASVKVSQDPSCSGFFREDWNSLVWLGMIRFGMRQHPSEAFVKVSSRFKFLLAV